MTYSTRFGAVLAASVCVVAIAAPAQAEARQFNIRSGSLKQVLEIYARETKQQILQDFRCPLGSKPRRARVDVGRRRAEAALGRHGL